MQRAIRSDAIKTQSILSEKLKNKAAILHKQLGKYHIIQPSRSINSLHIHELLVRCSTSLLPKQESYQCAVFCRQFRLEAGSINICNGRPHIKHSCNSKPCIKTENTGSLYLLLKPKSKTLV